MHPHRCKINLLPLVLFSLGTILETTSATASFPLALRDHMDLLVVRQTDPGTCATACSDSSTVANDCVNAGASAACLCTLPNAHLLQQCIDCSLLASRDADTLQTAQQISTSFNTVCVSSASTVPPLTVPGGPPASGSASATAPGTATPIPSLTTPLLTTPGNKPTTIQQVTVGPSTSDAPPATFSDPPAPTLRGTASRSITAPPYKLLFSFISVVGALVMRS